jgi:hypothetical protein
MQLRWGSYTHDSGEAALQILTDPLKDKAGRYYGYKQTAHIFGEKIAADQNTLIPILATLEAAYTVENKDLVLLGNDGTTIAYRMLTAPAIGGTRIAQGLNYPDDGRTSAEFGTFRHYEVSIEAEYHSGEINLLAFEEAVDFEGTGGLQFAISEPITGPPFKAQTKQLTPCMATQQGSAIGRLSYPTAFVPPPIWPLDEELWKRRVRYLTPRRSGKPGSPSYTEFEINWSYSFKRTGPFPAALPNLWPGAQ